MQNRGPQVLAVAIVFLITTWGTLALRFYVRTRMLRSVGRDDWISLFAQLVFTCYLAAQLTGVVYGTGQHIEDLEIGRARSALKAWFICEVFYVQSTCWAKIAVGMFLLKLAKQRVHRWILYVLMVGDIVFCQAFLFIILFQCIPISKFWERLGAPDIPGKCISPSVVTNTTYAVSVVNALADLAFASLPIFIIRNVPMARKNKLLVSTILAMGAVASIATILRIPYIKYLNDLDDFLWSTTDVAIWSTVEPGLGMTAANAATLRPLLRAFFGESGTTQDRSGDYTNAKSSRSLSTPGHRSRTVAEDGDETELVRNTLSAESDTIYPATDRYKDGHKLRTIWVDTEVNIEHQDIPRPIDRMLHELWTSPPNKASSSDGK